MSRDNIRWPKRHVCTGDLDRRVKIQTRSIQPPPAGSTDFTEKFTTVATVWAGIRTPRGKTFFDGANNVDTVITHEVAMRYRAGIDTETWIELPSGSRVNVLDAANLEERSEFLLLTCNERGPHSVLAAHV